MRLVLTIPIVYIYNTNNKNIIYIFHAKIEDKFNSS